MTKQYLVDRNEIESQSLKEIKVAKKNEAVEARLGVSRWPFW